VSESHTNRAVEDLLLHLRATRGFDFTAYKRPTLVRRIASRMRAVGVEDMLGYRDVLEADPASTRRCSTRS
jgi:two-component system, chemotaxis family, CheB/CheR fusion protein